MFNGFGKQLGSGSTFGYNDATNSQYLGGDRGLMNDFQTKVQKAMEQKGNAFDLQKVQQGQGVNPQEQLWYQVGENFNKGVKWSN